ncbi:MAG: DNA-binding response regulator [Clostridium sp.]
MKSNLNKDEVKILYLRGMDATQISNYLGATKSAVNKCIQRNFKEYKDIHVYEKRKNSFHDIAVKKALNYESKMWMSDKAFIDKNRSIFTTNELGNIVLRKDIDCELPWDVPRRLNNEFKGCY